VAVLAGAAVLRIRRFWRSAVRHRPDDACSATVMACEPGTRTLVLDAPWDGYLRELTVRLTRPGSSGILRAGDSVRFYGRPDGTGPLLVRSPGWRRAVPGWGTRQPAPGAGPPVPQDAPAAQGAGSSNRNRVILIGVGVAVLVVAIAVIAVVTSSSQSQLTADQLVPGDCLAGSNMALDTSDPWPDTVAAVPCTQPHEAEVFFVGNAWPESQAAYPGDDAISNQGNARCTSAFDAYDGLASSSSEFTFTFIAPDNTTWPSGDRLLVCVAYIQDDQSPSDGLPVKSSIKASRR